MRTSRTLNLSTTLNNFEMSSNERAEKYDITENYRSSVSGGKNSSQPEVGPAEFRDLRETLRVLLQDQRNLEKNVHNIN